MMAEGEAEQFSLRWNNFHSNLTAGFHALLQGEDLVDVTLAADGQFIRAHKIVLSVCSPYFKELFKVNPCKHPIVILKDVSHKDLVAILQFMYQGEVNVRQEELTTFLKTAEMLQIKGLTGDDSANEEETLPVPPVPVQRPRVVRRVMEKAPHAARASVEKKPQPAAELLTVEPEEAPTQPPFKRIRPEVSTASPAVTEENVTPSRSSASIDFVEISKPKMEPVEFETEIEEIESTPSNRDDPLVQLLGGESSQSMQDSSQGTGLFASIPGVSQDSGLSQDSGQDSVLEQSALRQGATKLNCSCTFCGKMMRKTSLKRHMEDRHLPPQSIYCSYCSKVFRTNNSYQNHLSKYHRDIQRSKKLKNSSSENHVNPTDLETSEQNEHSSGIIFS